MKNKTIIWLIVLIVVIASIFLFLFVKPKSNEIQAGQNISIVLDQKISSFACNPEAGNFGSRSEYYEIWKNPSGAFYLLHTETQITTRHPPDDMTGNTTIVDYFNATEGKEISGIVQESDLPYCFVNKTDLIKYGFCSGENDAIVCNTLVKNL